MFTLFALIRFNELLQLVYKTFSQHDQDKIYIFSFNMTHLSINRLCLLWYNALLYKNHEIAQPNIILPENKIKLKTLY